MDHIRLIASDMDATLLDERSQLPPDFAETIRALAGPVSYTHLTLPTTHTV